MWGRSGNRCAFCKRHLTQDSDAATASFNLGEQAHIVGEKPAAARGDSLLTDEERNSYHNLILLCPTHHTEIDSNEIDWPIERLHQKKSEHEVWVDATLGAHDDLNKRAQDAAVASVVDAAVDLCSFESWQAWTSHALAATPRWHEDMPGRVFRFRQVVATAVWPSNYEEFQRAARTLAIALHQACDSFMKHSDSIGDHYVADRFYRRAETTAEYDTQLAEFENWLDDCYAGLRQATKAANWFAEIVRRDINPMFFVASGRFAISEGPFNDLTTRFSVPEYTLKEKSALPDSLRRPAGVNIEQAAPPA